MANWSTTTKHEPISINNGRRYELRDRVSIEQLNNMTENSFYAMEASSVAKEKAEEALKFAQGSGTTVYENGSPVAEFNADKKANTTDLNNYYTKEQVDGLIGSGGSGDIDLSDYYTKSETDSFINELETNKQNVINNNNLLPSVFVDTSNTPNRQFVTSSEKESWNDKQEKIDLSNKLSANYVLDNSQQRFVTDAEKTQWNKAEQNVQSDWSVTDTGSDAFIKNKPNLSKVATSGSYNDLYDKPSIPTVDYPVTSVNGKTKDVQLSASDVGALPNTSKFGATLTGTQNVANNKIDIQLKDQDGNVLGSKLTFDVPYSTSALTNDSDFTTKSYVDGIKTNVDNAGYITNSVSNLANYYLKQETYTRAEVNELIGKIEKLTKQVVSSLPETGQENVIYLVPSTNGTQDNYDEYIYLTSPNRWEKIGNTDIDLSGYSTTEQMNTAISNATANLVPNTRKVNGKVLSADVTLNASDVGALPSSTTIPTVNNGKLTIQKNGTDVGSFTANQSGNTSVNITVPTTASDVGAEPVFTKNTAFNKNFGTTDGTVCQGNDSRLSDDRKNPNALTITQNGETKTYDGSTPVSIDIEKQNVDLPSNVVLTDGDAQTITKDLTIETRNTGSGGNSSITLGNSLNSIVNNPYIRVKNQVNRSFDLTFPYKTGTIALTDDIPDISGKVDKETGKGLSTNDYTTVEKNKLAGLSNYTAGNGISIENGVIGVEKSAIIAELSNNYGIPAINTKFNLTLNQVLNVGNKLAFINNKIKIVGDVSVIKATAKVVVNTSGAGNLHMYINKNGTSFTITPNTMVNGVNSISIPNVLINAQQGDELDFSLHSAVGGTVQGASYRTYLMVEVIK